MAQAGADMLHSMAELTKRDHLLFFGALNKLCVTNPSMAPNGKQLVELGNVMVPALAAAREEGRREAIEECAKIATKGKYRQTAASDCPDDIGDLILALLKEPK
jgi:hypothetical protein